MPNVTHSSKCGHNKIPPASTYNACDCRAVAQVETGGEEATYHHLNVCQQPSESGPQLQPWPQIITLV